MADAEEVKLETFHKKSTSGKRASAVDNYDELADQKTPVSDPVPPQDEPAGLLWPGFIKDYESSLFYGSKFFYEQAGNYILVFNEDGFRVFDASLDSLEPVITVNKDLLLVEGDDKYALLSYDNAYVLVSAGREKEPQDWCVEVHSISSGVSLCELRASDISEDIPAQATAQVSWLTDDCFTIYTVDEGSNYAARFIFKVNAEELKVDCVVKCPLQQVTDESPSFLYSRVTPESVVRRGTGRYGTPLAVGLVTKHSCWEMYAVQENFRSLGTMCPFNNERNAKEVWNRNSRYVAFYYLDDVESNREICVYDFGEDQKNLQMRECFKAPMFPGESYDDVDFEFFQTGSSTTVLLHCTAEEKGELLVYDLAKSEAKSDLQLQRKMSMAAVEQKLSNMRVLHLHQVTSRDDEGQSYGGFGDVPFQDVADLTVLSTMYDQVPKKFYVHTLHDQTSVSVYDIENGWQVVVDNYSPFGKEKFKVTFSDVGAVLSTTNVVNPAATAAACLLLPLADPVKETRQRLQVIDIAHAGRVMRNETFEFHEAFLTPRHSFVVVRFHLNFTILDLATSTRQKTIVDWDPEDGEVASSDIVREVSPDDRFLAVGARHQIRVFQLSLQAGVEPVAILDYTETCKELKFTSCLPMDYPPPSHACNWDHLYFEDGGRMFVRYEEEGNHFVPLHKVHESRKQLIHLSNTLMLAVQPPPEYDWEPQNPEGESLEVLRVDLDLQNVLDISTIGSNVDKIGESQRILITDKKSLRVLDFTIADRLVDSLTFFQDTVIVNVSSTNVGDDEWCAVVTADPLSRSTQQLSMMKFIRTGPELISLPNGGTRFSPFEGKKFKVEFLPSYRAEYMLLISVADEISLYSLSGGEVTPVASVQNYVLPAKFDDSVSENDSWVEITTLKGVQMINLNAVNEDSYNPREDWLGINTSRGLRSIGGNRSYVLRDKSASFSIYEFKEGERPQEVLAINRVCDTENKMGAPEIDLSASDDGRFLMVKNCFTFSADTCFVLVYDLKTLSKVPILRRNYGQATHTNFSVFFPTGSCMHLVICTPGGKNVEVYDLLACARQAAGPGGEVKPTLQITVENNDFLKLIDSTRVSLDNVRDEDSDDENKEEKTLDELLAELENPTPEPAKKKAPPPPSASSAVEEKVEPLTSDQKNSRSLFWVLQKSNSNLSFYYLTATEAPKLLRSMKVFDRQEVDVDFNWPYIYLTPLPKKNDCKIIKVTETKEGKLVMDDRFDYWPTLPGSSTEIKNVQFREMDDKTYVKLVNASGLTVHRVGESSEKIYELPGETGKLQFDFLRSSTRATVFTTGTPNGFLVDFSTSETVNILPPARRNEKITQLSCYGGEMTVYTMHSVLLFEYKSDADLRNSLKLKAEIDVDPSWPSGSWEFDLKFDNKLGVLKRTDYSSCLAIYRNVQVLDGEVHTTKWPLVDVLIDQKTDPEWANASITYVHEYMYCHSPAKKGFTIIDLSRLLVAWYPLITWSSTENVLKYDLERYNEEMPHVDTFLHRYQEILVGPMSPKDPLSAVNHLCTSSHNAISDGRHRALQLFLLHMPQGAFELNTTAVPSGESYPRPRRTALGALIAKKDWVSVSMLLDFLVIAHMQQSLVPLNDRCLEFGFELVDLAYQHSPQRAARFLKDFALQKLPMKSAVVQDAMRGLNGVRFGNAKCFTAGTQIREPNNLWSVKLKNMEGGDRFQVCYVAIPGLSSDKSEAYPTPMFHQLVQVAQDTQCAELIANPGIEAVIDYKWNTFARSRFLINFGLHLFVTLCVILFCSFLPLQDKNDPLSVVAQSSEGALCIAMLTFFLCYGAYNVWKEGRELVVQGVKNYLGVWNFAANVQSALLIATAILYLERSSHTHFVAGATVLICHIYILFYLQALETTGPLIRMILQITSDMKYFTGVLVLCLIACTFFYIVVTEGTGMGAGNVAEVWLRMYMTFFFFNFDSSAIDDLATTEQITVSYLMIVVGSMFVAIVLLNLLIALMGDSFATIKARDTLELQLLRAGMIRDIEFTMTIKTASMVKERFPLWVHCLLPIKEAPIREVNETLSELRKLRSDVAKLEEKLQSMSLSSNNGGGNNNNNGGGNGNNGGGGGGGGGGRRRRASLALGSARGSVANEGGRESQTLEELLKSLEDP